MRGWTVPLPLWYIRKKANHNAQIIRIPIMNDDDDDLK